MSVPCDVCLADDFETLTAVRSPRVPRFRARAVICRRCGFVTIRPRPAAEEYARINDQWFAHEYGGDPDSGGGGEAAGRKKAARLWERVHPYYPAGIASALDIGAGLGWSFELLRSKYPNIALAAIERVPELQEGLRARYRATIVASDVGSSWAEAHEAQFDLVIFRHTLEHMESPFGVLRCIVKCLAPGGMAYIVVPNVLRVPPGQCVRTDLFRPVHLHYFNRHTFVRLLRRAGLAPVTLEEGGEIWGLFRRAEDEAPTDHVNSYVEQRAHLVRRLEEAKWADAKTVTKIVLRQLVPQRVLEALRAMRRNA